jgi:hypothetical protein
MKHILLRAVAAAAIAAAGVYVLKKVFSGRGRVKEAVWSNNLPISLSDKATLPKSSYKMMHPIFWAGIE